MDKATRKQTKKRKQKEKEGKCVRKSMDVVVEAR
jgi:hypothetical protein